MTTRKQFYKTGFENNKLVKRLYRQVGKAIGDYRLIEEGDKVMVCLSGGKDSFVLLDVLLGLKARAPIRFDIVAVHLNPQFPDFPTDVLPAYLEEKNVPFHIETQAIYPIIRRLIPSRPTREVLWLPQACLICRLKQVFLWQIQEPGS